MRFMMIIKSDEVAETGAMPPDEGIAAMQHFNEELVKSGVLLAAEGLHPSARGAKVIFTDGTATVTDGPFTEAKEMIAGFNVIECDSMDEAAEIAAWHPVTRTGVIEIRPIWET